MLQEVAVRQSAGIQYVPEEWQDKLDRLLVCHVLHCYVYVDIVHLQCICIMEPDTLVQVPCHPMLIASNNSEASEESFMLVEC